MNNAESMRHRAVNKHIYMDTSPLLITIDQRTKCSDGKMHNRKLHASVWVRFAAIVSVFTILAVTISYSYRIGGPKQIIGHDKNSHRFVTIVMPRSVRFLLS